MKSKDKSVQKGEIVDDNVEEKMTPEKEIESLKSELESSNDQMMRIAADFDNYRKRVARDKEQQNLRTKGEVISRFLEIIDTIDKAKESDYPDLESSLKGISGLQKLVSAFMESQALEKIVPKGETFDFRFHEALTTVENSEVDPDKIVDVIQSGYKLEGELLRPAKVVVSKKVEGNSE